MTVEKALSAVRESKHLEFKQSFDPDQLSEWCELIKDVVALANSGGGILIFGLDNLGKLATSHLAKIGALDPADIANKLSRYIGKEEIELEVRFPEKDGKPLILWKIGSSSVPITFEKPGTYPIADGKQKTAFSEGTTYFRHSAKSEPGNNNDLRWSISRYVELLRRSWLSGVKQVVSAPLGSTFSVGSPADAGLSHGTFRAVSDPSAPHVQLTRDPSLAKGIYLHEEVSETLFKEINSVLDANRILFHDKNRFLLGTQIYHRVYSERTSIRQPADEIEKLFNFAITDYAPALFWCRELAPSVVASYWTRIFLNPKGNEIHTLTRTAPLLGANFCVWMSEKFKAKWGKYSQPPTFFISFVELVKSDLKSDPRVLASKLAPQGLVDLPNGQKTSTADLLKGPACAADLLSEACKEVFDGKKELRPLCRALDYIAYGTEIMDQGPDLAKLIMDGVGDNLPHVN